MRERLVVTFVMIAALVVLVFGVSRAYYVGDLIRTQEQRKVERAVVLLAAVVNERVVNDEPLSAAQFSDFLNEAEKVEYDGPGGRHLEAEGPGHEDQPSEDDLVARAPVAAGGEVTLTRSGYLLRERVSDAVTPLVVLGMVLIAVAALVGYLAARRIARPFRDLIDVAAQLGRGRFDVTVPHFSTPEAEQLGRALEASAEQLHDLLRREREFATNASHQLRTPITALRLELEDLALWPETPEVVGEQLRHSLRELDRLAATVTGLLERTRTQHFGSPLDTDVSGLVEEAVRRWAPRVAAAGRDIRVLTTGPVVVHRAPGPIDQVLDVLIENALLHGVGQITAEATRLEDHVKVRVWDEGEPHFGTEVFDAGVNRSTSEAPGPGLVGAAEAANTMSGRLTLEDSPVTTFSLMLPVD